MAAAFPAAAAQIPKEVLEMAADPFLERVDRQIEKFTKQRMMSAAEREKQRYACVL